MEIGAGDCAMSIAAAKQVRAVFAVEVSKEITSASTLPKNVTLVLSDGVSIPVAKSAVDVVYSNQLMEHLHPDDAKEQLENIAGALRNGGKYVCITPNRLSGPHDVSRYFSKATQGFHLKEYAVHELAELFLKSGFSQVQTYIGGKGWYLPFPRWIIVAIERRLEGLPHSLGRIIARTSLFRALLGVIIVGIK